MDWGLDNLSGIINSITTLLNVILGFLSTLFSFLGGESESE